MTRTIEKHTSNVDRLIDRGGRLIVGATLAIGIAVGGVVGVATDQAIRHQPTDPIILTENTADAPRDRQAFTDLRDDLLARGWYGIPGDGCECLYPPQR